MNIFDYVYKYIRLCYQIVVIHHDSTFEKEYVVKQRDRRLGSYHFDQLLLNNMPAQELEYTIRKYSEELINKDLEDLPWHEYYAV